MTKTCNKCGVEKPKSGFSKRSSSKDGLHTECKSCAAIRAKEYRALHAERLKEQRKARMSTPAGKAVLKAWNIANRERILAQRKAWRAAHRDKVAAQKRASYLAHKEYVCAKSKAWRAANPEKVVSNNRAWYEANRDRASDRSASYYEANREAILQWNADYYKQNVALFFKHYHRRRARKLGAEGAFTEEDVQRILKQQKGLCVYCLRDILKGFHRDHIVALADGGSNFPSNIQLLCGPCNLSKGKKTHLEFIRYRVRLGRFVAPELIPEDLLL